ncbi:MAG TPA: hypothetical protein VKE70_11675 [Candidatus Solibacter sp.]|nr:hypothetical protein [Candidatus Solibacter sp.]
MKNLLCLILCAPAFAATLSSITNVHYGAPDGIAAHGCSYLVVDNLGLLNTSTCGSGVYDAPVGSGFPDIVTNWQVGGATFAQYGILGAKMLLSADGNYEQEVGSLSSIVTASFSDKLTISSASLGAFSVVQFTPIFTVTGFVNNSLSGNFVDTETRKLEIDDGSSGSITYNSLTPGVYVGQTVSVFTNQAFNFGAILQLSNSLTKGVPNGGPLGLGGPFSFSMQSDFLDPVWLSGITITKNGNPVTDFALTSQSGTDYLAVINQVNGAPEPAPVWLLLCGAGLLACRTAIRRAMARRES